MNTKKLYKKIGIKDIEKLNRNEISTIASDIAIKLCLAFPNNNLDRQYLFNAINGIDMFTATMEKNLDGAKYVFETNAIYLNNKLNFEEYPNIAMHECIHFLQKQKSNKQMGLYNFSSGLALNEAAVQLMAAEANMSNISEEKLYDISLKTNTPNYYPLECAILKQMIYLGGKNELYNSTLNSNDNFRTEFINNFNRKTYNYISKNLDNLLNLENDLNYYIDELTQTSKTRTIASLNNIIATYKKDISIVFFKMQNYILKNCFLKEFNKINNEDDIHNLKNKLYEFKDIIGFTDNYTFYNDFYRDMMLALEDKRQEINGVMHTELTLTKQNKNFLSIIRRLFRKLTNSAYTKKINS